ncbi:WXG100 family type VII secretion target [Nocardia callitridis]|uniref:ESAT-6-like protein n=1 Tax=Nocardia callitridis TaxID=648753 RepID=A0ABP9KT65_9NOCA
MAGKVQLGVAEIDQVSGDMETSINTVRSHIQRIEEAADTVRAGWRGDANDSFIKSATEWHDEAERLKAILTAMQAAVVDGKARLLAMDASNV